MFSFSIFGRTSSTSPSHHLLIRRYWSPSTFDLHRPLMENKDFGSLMVTPFLHLLLIYLWGFFWLHTVRICWSLRTPEKTTVVSAPRHHPGPPIITSHTSVMWPPHVWAQIPAALLTRGAILKSKLLWEDLEAAPRRARRRLQDGWTAAVRTPTLSLLTGWGGGRRPPRLSAFPKVLAQIPAWPRQINCSMDRTPQISFCLLKSRYV